MIELTIKTLDAQNHHFTVPNDYTVEQLKEHIADTIQIPSESQRCIYLGQVLQNDAKLADCDVNGKVIHVVQRPPPSSAYSNANDNPTPNSGPAPGRRQETHTGTMYLGAMAFPADFVDAGGLTFLHQLHPRTNLSMSRLAVARNLLRRTATIINQLESENYFNSSSEQNNQFLGFSGNNLSDEITNGGLDQPEVEIRVESPNSRENASENVENNVNNDLPESAGLNGASTNQDNADDSQNTDTASNAQNTDGASGTSSRDDSNRRRPSRTPMMATVMGAVLHAQIRLIPFMRLLRQYLIQDTTFGPDSQTTHTEQQVQSLYNSVSELMHYFAHIYHSLSDIMCDFSQPPPRTLRCRPVILQQQHATVLSRGPRARQLIRAADGPRLGPLIMHGPRISPPTMEGPRMSPMRGPRLDLGTPRLSRSALLTMTTSPDTSANSTNPPTATTTTTSTATESNSADNDASNRDVGASSVEVVIEEADTTNMQDNTDDGPPENMDLGEPTEEGSANDDASGGASTVTMRARGGNTFVIQSMPSLPDGVLPDGIRINSVEATILAPNEDLASALTGDGNTRGWRAGILPAEVLQNMFGLINQVRSTQRQQQQQQQQQRATNGERQRQPNAENGTEAGQPANNTNESNQSSDSPHERLEFDIAGVSRTFDPFLPCHSHHIHPVTRSTSSRNATQNTATQASSNQSGPSTQTQSGATQTAATDDQSSPQQQQQQRSTTGSQSATNDTAGQQQSANRNETDGGISIPDVTRNVASFINNIFPGLNIGNLMIRRGTADAANPPAEGADRNIQAPRARIQVTSNLNAIFPGAIQIEIDPLTNNVQANVVPNNANQSTENRPRFRRARPIRRPRANATANGQPNTGASENADSNENPASLPSPLSLSSPSSAYASSLSSDEDVANFSGREKKKPKKEENHEYSTSKAIKNFYAMVQKESVRSHLSSKKSNDSKKDTAAKYPLYRDNQEALFLEIVNSAIKNISLEQLTGGCEATAEQLASSVCRNIRNYLSTQPNTVSSIKEDLLNVVNVIINNDLYKMKNLLDSDCVKQEIDLVSTICKFNQDSIPELIECIINCEDLSETEIKKFYQILKFYVARLLTLFVHCIAGNDKSVNIRKVLASVIEEILKGLPKNEELAGWLRKDLINHVISYSKICHPDNLPAFMKHYVVYRLPPVMPVKCTVATALTSGGNNNATTSQQAQPMEVEEAAQSSSSNSSEASFVSANSEENRAAGESTNAPVPNNPPNNSSTSSTETVPEVRLNSEEWHRSFPSDWVPIIARDIHRLRRQGSQPPYSDAYLSGMPTKRRKLIKNSKPNVNSNEQIINGNITSAIDNAGFSASLNSVSNLVTSENAVDPNAESLSNMAKEELKENVRENIVQQTDFLPSRFPDSAKYFMDK